MLTELIVYLGVCLVVGLAALGVLRWRFPQWEFQRAAELAALPVPLVSWGLCVFLFAKVAMSSRASCGVDACGMAMGASMLLAVAALAGFTLSWLGGLALLYVLDRWH